MPHTVCQNNSHDNIISIIHLNVYLSIEQSYQLDRQTNTHKIMPGMTRENKKGQATSLLHGSTTGLLMLLPLDNRSGF